jgi:hypothetical protein
MGESITVETDIFEHRQVKPHFINPCCFGEDFAAWLKEELPKDGDLNFKFSEPIQEDYGWGLWATGERERLWIAISYAGDGPQEPPPQWVISVKRDSGLNVIRLLRSDTGSGKLLSERIRKVLEGNPGIRIVK